VCNLLTEIFWFW